MQNKLVVSKPLVFHRQWRPLDAIDFINLGMDASFLHDNADARWDINAECFWIIVGSPADTWLKLKGC